MIDTAERRRSAIDFGKDPRGTGMPIPCGTVGVDSRGHALNLYPGITPINSFFFFWRNRHLSTSSFQTRTVASSTWGKAVMSDSSIFRQASEVKDS